MVKRPKGMIEWRNRRGEIQVSFEWLLADDQARDSCGLTLWEQAGFFGPHRCDTRDRAIEMARIKLTARGFDPDTAEKLIVQFKDRT